MGKRRRVLLAAFAVAAVGGLAWAFLVLRSPEPVYQGKPLEYWLAGYDSRSYNRIHPDGPPPPTWKEADDAIRQMGTKAIPALLRKLQTRDSKIKALIAKVLQKQQFIKISYSPTTEFWSGLHGFSALGPAASNALPQLVRIYERDASAFTQQAVSVIFGKIGPAAAQAVPALLRETAHTNWVARNNALFALRQIHPDSKSVVPIFLNCLNDSNVMVRAQAVRALGSYGRDAHVAAPAILELWGKEPRSTGTGGMLSYEGWVVAAAWLRDSSGIPSPDVRQFAGEALKAVDSEAAAEAGVK